jgi:glycosyltransferase involved in cell wall biosynthesis
LAAIDVLLPVRNGMPYLSEAIESIRRQTYADWRLLILDHGSSDGSAELAADYAGRDQRVRLLTIPEAPDLAGLRNRGLSQCDCRIMMLQDADDVALPERMAQTLAVFAENPQCVVIGGEAVEIDSHGREKGYLRAPSNSTAITSAAFFYCPVVHPAAAVNFPAFRRLGAAYGKDFLGIVPESESIAVNRLAEDYILIGQLALLGLCVNVPVPLIKYRRHPSSVGISNHEAQVEVSLKISRFLSKSFCLMNRVEEFDPGPFCSHGDYVFDFQRDDYSDQFDQMARALGRGLGSSPELSRELAFRRILAKRKHVALMYRFVDFQRRYGARPAELRTVRNWLLRNVRRNKYIYRSDLCYVN